MTGLNPEKDRIIEIATIVTDSNLNVIEEGPVFAIHQSDELLESMDEWNTSHHNASGLVERIKKSQITEAMAEQQTLDFLKKHVLDGKSPLCGNTIWQDRRFLACYMPNLEKFFHYRLIDVSTLKELAQRWAPKIYNEMPEKEALHLALADIRDSIAELRYYRQHLLVREAHIDDV
jgi:oligoribonuclease